MIQIDMPMPKNCADCCFATADLVNGTITLFCMTQAGRRMFAPGLIDRKDRPEWCPLEEQEEKTQGADSGMCEICSFYERAMPVKPVRDEQTGRLWLCGKCGSYVGFEDNDPYDPNEFDKYCRECGRPVLWEGR